MPSEKLEERLQPPSPPDPEVGLAEGKQGALHLLSIDRVQQNQVLVVMVSDFGKDVRQYFTERNSIAEKYSWMFPRRTKQELYREVVDSLRGVNPISGDVLRNAKQLYGVYQHVYHMNQDEEVLGALRNPIKQVS